MGRAGQNDDDKTPSEAVLGLISEQIFAAVRKHDVRLLGYPEVEIVDSGDGSTLSFKATADVRPARTLRSGSVSGSPRRDRYIARS